MEHEGTAAAEQQFAPADVVAAVLDTQQCFMETADTQEAALLLMGGSAEDEPAPVRPSAIAASILETQQTPADDAFMLAGTEDTAGLLLLGGADDGGPAPAPHAPATTNSALAAAGSEPGDTDAALLALLNSQGEARTELTTAAAQRAPPVPAARPRQAPAAGSPPSSVVQQAAGQRSGGTGRAGSNAVAPGQRKRAHS